MLNITSDFLSGILGQVGDLFTAMKPLIFLVLGIYIGVWIVEEIVELIRNRFVEKEEVGALLSEEELLQERALTKAHLGTLETQLKIIEAEKKLKISKGLEIKEA